MTQDKVKFTYPKEIEELMKAKAQKKPETTQKK